MGHAITPISKILHSMPLAPVHECSGPCAEAASVPRIFHGRSFLSSLYHEMRALHDVHACRRHLCCGQGKPVRGAASAGHPNSAGEQPPGADCGRIPNHHQPCPHLPLPDSHPPWCARIPHPCQHLQFREDLATKWVLVKVIWKMHPEPCWPCLPSGFMALMNTS